MVRSLLRVLLTAVIMLAAIAYFFQDRLLHYPEAIEPATALAVAKTLNLAPWPDAAAPLGWLRETPTTTRGTIILFHGNGGHALHRSWFADEWEKLGYRTLLAEYPGYGHRSNSAATATDETSLVADAARLIGALRQSRGGRLIVAGESLGAGVASAALARGADQFNVAGGIAAVMLITPWNDLASVAGHHYPLLPIRLLLRDRYDTTANLQHFRGPKLVLLAGRDAIIPARFGHRLFEQLGTHKKLIELPNSGHNDWVDAMSPANWQEALKFLEESPQPSSGH